MPGMRLWEPLTAQFGDLTYWGEWIVTGGAVHVRCDHGGASRPLAPDDHALAVAERLLIDLLRERGKL
ncbi:hypothetical protein [Phenylobacterium sp.]|uniref:hypothetical protein n=1 Tax=Phenylobacterium sp. TaxID=1871053 RepID=UPI002C59328F|nr:hypothetical protein [Phenylobacterium sp.]HVI31292.1 hypothetical protein [Phenylobacterium sp.]